MRILSFSGAVAIVLLINGCVAVEFYQFPGTIEEYATIEDDSLGFMPRRSWVRIASIDRQVVYDDSRGVPRKSGIENDNEKELIAITEGEHQLLVEAGTVYLKAFDIIVWASVTRRFSKAVIFLEAENGGRYRVQAVLDIDGDYADFWIEDAETGNKVTEPIRVIGLDDSL